MDIDGFLELVKKRKSIRRFKPDPIPDEYVDKILEAARWAMSGANGQTWEFIVVKSKETKQKILDLYVQHRESSHKMELTRVPELRHPQAALPPKGPPGFADAPVWIVVCQDPRRVQASVMVAHIVSSENRLVHVNHANCTQNIHLAAAALGLGAMWFSINPGWETELRLALGVPSILRIYTIVPIGYPAYAPSPSYRRELKEMVHYEHYDMSKFMSEDDVWDFLVQLRKRQTPTYHV